jgi:hypothetical protein
MIEHRELVIGVGIPWPVDLERPGGLPGIGVAQVGRDAAVLALELTDRIAAAVLAQPVGFRPEKPTLLYDGSMAGWGPDLVKRRPDITMEMIEKYLTRMYRNNPDFVLTVTRDFVRNCQTPILVLPDDIPAHPYAVAMESAMLAPNAEVSVFPWKEPPERIPLAVRQVRSFLRAHRPASA